MSMALMWPLNKFVDVAMFVSIFVLWIVCLMIPPCFRCFGFQTQA